MIKEEYYITDYCSIRNSKVSKNGKLLYSDTNSETVKEFAKGIYTHIGLKYPKFHKMDELCKLGFLASEILLSHMDTIAEDTALVLSNQASSLDTDRTHQESIKDRSNFFPSPAVFVYTLPNIIMGEISIRNTMKSENAFFVSEKFDAVLISKYAEILMQTNKASSVICGWVDLDTDNYDVFLAFISKKGKTKLSETALSNLYKK